MIYYGNIIQYNSFLRDETKSKIEWKGQTYFFKIGKYCFMVMIQYFFKMICLKQSIIYIKKHLFKLLQRQLLILQIHMSGIFKNFLYFYRYGECPSIIVQHSILCALLLEGQFIFCVQIRSTSRSSYREILLQSNWSK